MQNLKVGRPPKYLSLDRIGGVEPDPLLFVVHVLVAVAVLKVKRKHVHKVLLRGVNELRRGVCILK